MENKQVMEPKFAVEDPDEAFEGASVEDIIHTRIKIAQRLNLSESFIKELDKQVDIRSSEAMQDYKLNKKADIMLEELLRDGSFTVYMIKNGQKSITELRKITEILRDKLKEANLDSFISVRFEENWHDPAVFLEGQIDSIKTSNLPKSPES